MGNFVCAEGSTTRLRPYEMEPPESDVALHGPADVRKTSSFCFSLSLYDATRSGLMKRSCAPTIKQLRVEITTTRHEVSEKRAAGTGFRPSKIFFLGFNSLSGSPS